MSGNGANYKFGLSKAISETKQQISRELRRANQKYAQKVISGVLKDLRNDLFDAVVTSSVRFYIATKAGMIVGEIFD